MENKRFYYPYCGWKRGFCMAENGCTMPENTVYLSFDCKNFKARHPITKKKPQGLR